MGVLGALSAQSGALLARGVFALSTGLTFPFTKSGVLLACAVPIQPCPVLASTGCPVFVPPNAMLGQICHEPIYHGPTAELGL